MQTFLSSRPARGMLFDRRGDSMVETVVIIAIVLATVGGVLYSIFQALQGNLTDVLNGL
jgi:hypothetical protein